MRVVRRTPEQVDALVYACFGENKLATQMLVKRLPFSDCQVRISLIRQCKKGLIEEVKCDDGKTSKWYKRVATSHSIT